MRQGELVREYDPKRGVSIATLAYEYPPNFRVPEHAHASDQLIYAVRGVMEVSAGQSYWLIPPQFAVWIPALTMHKIRMSGAVSMRTLYARPGVAARLPSSCAVLHVSPLLRELIIETVRIGELRTSNRLHCALRDVIVARMQQASPVAMSVTLPKEPRAFAIAAAIIGDPSGMVPFDAVCKKAGVSVRTAERLFQSETGMTFESWRMQARLMKAIERLAGGSSVKEAAFDVGYRQPSAFVEMFRRALGTTPKKWIAQLSAH